MRDRAPTHPIVPAFTAVPRKHVRHDGWTADRQKAFLEALAETGSVKHACNRVNMASEGAYALRRAPGSESFTKAWAAALDHGVQRLADLAIDRAIDGVEVPVYSYGKLVGTRRVYNDRLLMFCLRHGIGREEGVGGAKGPVLTPGPALRRGGAKAAETMTPDSDIVQATPPEIAAFEIDHPGLLDRMRAMMRDEMNNLNYLCKLHLAHMASLQSAIAANNPQSIAQARAHAEKIRRAIDTNRPWAEVGREIADEYGPAHHWGS